MVKFLMKIVELVTVAFQLVNPVETYSYFLPVLRHYLLFSNPLNWIANKI